MGEAKIGMGKAKIYNTCLARPTAMRLSLQDMKSDACITASLRDMLGFEILVTYESIVFSKL